ncbi:TetR family transcriptional regulator C-terminal domain-containing protein [Luteimonas dalianensis]|uniref:TetR family transcriptional regulator C-terminal domain-containing protein n=1 Tax=Luteimonas dalianensis TaxID=1148196 RepID=UPI003BF06E37
MKKSKFTEEQIAFALKQAEATRNPEIAGMLQAFDQQTRQVFVSRLGDDSADAASRGEILAALFDGLAVRALRNPELARTLDRDMLRTVMASVLNA